MIKNTIKPLKKQKNLGLARVLIHLSLLLLSPFSTVLQADIIAGDPIAIGRNPLDRQYYALEFKATAINTGDQTETVTATLTSNSNQTQIMHGQLHFGDIVAGGTKTSQNSFQIKQDRHIPFDANTLQWQYQHTPKPNPDQPTANAAHATGQIPVGQPYVFDGTGSTSAQGKALEYNWHIAMQPFGSMATLENTDSATPTLIPDKPGTYLIQLIVRDGLNYSVADTITITTENSAPTAVINTSTAAHTQQFIYLDGRDSADLDNDELHYQWQLLNKPTGSNSQINQANTAIASLTPDTAGTYQIQLIVNDGNQDSPAQIADIQVTDIVIDNYPPQITSTPPLTADDETLPILSQYQYQISATDPENDPIQYQILSAPSNATLDPITGHFQFFAETAGTYSINLTAQDNQGHQSVQNFQIIVQETDQTLPPNPIDIATDYPKTEFQNLKEANAFLYQHNPPIQTGLDPTQIEFNLAALITGRVYDKASNPLSGVRIHIKNHPEYGQTFSREDGKFDLMVNAPDELILEYTKIGYLSAQRKVTPQRQDFVHPQNVNLLPLSPKVTTIQSNQPQMQVVQGETNQDIEGRRQATLFIPANTSATMHLPDGSTQPLNDLDIRITEYTLGKDGKDAMPAALPENSGYTYAAELSVDQAISANATKVTFNQAIPFYVDNFLHFPIGESVPLGWYDRQTSQWIAADNGRVIKILSIDLITGQAELDLTGDGQAATTAELNQLNISDEERTNLATLYQIGQSFWRTQISHFTPWDCNWPYGPPQDAIAPSNAAEAQPKVLSELPDTARAKLTFPLANSPYTLHYNSDEADESLANYSIQIPLSGETVPDSLKHIKVIIKISGQQYIQYFPPSPNQQFRYTWDGLDAYGRPQGGKHQAHIRIEYGYDLQYYQSSTAFMQSFNRVSTGDVIGIRNNQSITIKKDWTVLLGVSKNNSAGLGGMSINIHHAYDPLNQFVFEGTGTYYQSRRQIVVKHSIQGIVGTELPGNTIEGQSALNTSINGPSVIAEWIDGGLIFTSFNPRYNQNKLYHISPNGLVEERADLEGYQQIEKFAVAPDGTIYFIAQHIDPVTNVEQWNVYGLATDGMISQINQQPLISEQENTPYDYTYSGLSYYNGALHFLKGIYFNIESDAPATPAVKYRTVDLNVTKHQLLILNLTTGDLIEPFNLNDYPELGNGINAPDERCQQFSLLNNNYYFSDACRLTVYKMKIGTQNLQLLFKLDELGIDFGYGRLTFIPLANDNAYIFNRNEGNIVFYQKSTGKGEVIAGNNNGGSGVIGKCDGTVYPSDDLSILFLSYEDDKKIIVQNEQDLLIPSYNCIWRLFPNENQSIPSGLVLGDYIVPSKDGTQDYIFNKDGRHKATRNKATGDLIYTFEYNPDGTLSLIRDEQTGIETLIHRDAQGNAKRIETAGQATTLTTNTQGHITDIQQPNGDTDQLAYIGDTGLVYQHTDPAGVVTDFYYDAVGRVRDSAPVGGGYSEIMEGGSHYGNNQRIGNKDIRKAVIKTDDDIVASIPGSLSVNPNGSANYRIPIIIAPGTAGVEPKLSLNYNSQGSNGLLGIGWSVSGLSGIIRCGKTIVQDGQKTGVNFSSENDRFCMDGQRLLLVNNKQYGEDGAEYRTQINNFSRIISHGGSLQNGPDYFTVETKGGDLLEYGNTADSRVEGQGTQIVREWDINQVKDKLGNYYKVNYLELNEAGIHGPSSIEYTGNDKIGDLPYAKIIYEYEERPDKNMGYLAGSKVSLQHRIKSISSWQGNTLIRHYGFDYSEPDFANSITRLIRVNSCMERDANGNGVKCLPPTDIDWQMADVGFGEVKANTQTPPPDFRRGPHLSVLDFNGDGISDIVYSGEDIYFKAFNRVTDEYPIKDTGYIYPLYVDLYDRLGNIKKHMKLGNVGDFDFKFAESLGCDKSNIASYYLVLDYDGNGTQDILVPQKVDLSPESAWRHELDKSTDAEIQDYCSTSSNYQRNPKTSIYKWKIFSFDQQSQQSNVILDFPGNFKTVKWQGNDLTRSLIGRSNVTYSIVNDRVELDGLSSIPNYGLQTIDQNGDNLRELIPNAVCGDPHRCDNNLPQVMQFDDILDVNGDGLEDLFYVNEFFYLSTGDSFVAKRTFWTNPDKHDLEIYPGEDTIEPNLFIDINADGYQDLVYYDPHSGVGYHRRYNKGNMSVSDIGFSEDLPVNVYISDDEGMKNPIYFTNDFAFESAAYALPIDYNKDGLLDLFIPHRNNGTPFTWFVYLAERVKNEADFSFTAIDTLIPVNNDFEQFSPRTGDFNGDGLPDLLFYENNEFKIRFHKKVKGNLVNKITSGVGRQNDIIKIAYKPLTDPSVYTKEHNAFYPTERDFQGPVYVVSDVWIDDGEHKNINNTTFNHQKYTYTGSKIHALGRGNLGFRSQTVEDVNRGIKETTIFRQDYPYTGMAEIHFTTNDQNVILNGSINQFSAKWSGIPDKSPVFPYISHTLSGTFNLSAGAFESFDKLQWLTKNEISTEYDNLGNAIKVETTTTGPWTTQYTSTPWTNTKQIAISQYDNDLVHWHLGRLKSTITTTTGGQTSPNSITRKASFTYYNNSPAEQKHFGMLKTEQIETGLEAVTSTHIYDDYGNEVQTIVHATSPDGTPISRTSYSTYQNFGNIIVPIQGRYPVGSQNELGQREYYQVDQPLVNPNKGGASKPLGHRTELKGPNGLYTYWQYDDLGRQIKEIRLDGTTTELIIRWCDSICANFGRPEAVYYILTKEIGSPLSAAFYDKKDRIIRQSVESFNGSGEVINVDTDYHTELNSKGLIKSVTRPFYLGTTPLYKTHYTYDSYNRVINEESPITGQTTTKYDGAIVWQTNALGQKTGLLANAEGKPLFTQDPEGKLTSYQYDAVGNQRKIIDSKGHIIENFYNLRGEKIANIDGDMGKWYYYYNGLGELEYQKDANGNVVRIKYDALGRMIERENGHASCTQKTCQGWSTTSTNTKETWLYDTRPFGIGKLAKETAPGISTSYYYDNKGRLKNTKTIIDGITYTSTVTYDSKGRVETQTYPGGQNIITRNHYNDQGYLYKLTDANKTKTYWEGLETNVDGSFTKETVGIKTRLNGYNETTGRLEKMTVDGLQENVYRFDSIGNLTRRKDLISNSDEAFFYDNRNRLLRSERTVKEINENSPNVQTLKYDELGNITEKYGHPYNYHPNRPHAVKTAYGNTYHYDNNGNNKTGAGRTLTWNWYNKPTRITKGSNQVQFQYDATHARFKKIETKGTETTTTTYVGSYEKIQKSNGIIEHRHYIGGNAIEIVRSDSTKEIRYLLKDHLGSTEKIINGNGKLLESLSFDAFGKRRNPIYSQGNIPEASDAEKLDIIFNWAEIEYSAWFPEQRTTENIEGYEARGPYTTHNFMGAKEGKIFILGDGFGGLIEVDSVDNLYAQAILSSNPDINHAPIYTPIESIEPRGYTGHEMLDSVGLIHMNGRVYDPELGRFLSADSVIPDALNMQSLNRYSYVYNNPLSYTDPSGHIPGRYQQIVTTIVAIAVSVYAGPYAGEAFASWVGVADAAAISAGTASVTASYAAAYAVGYGLAAGTIGGVSSMAFGGTFADGLQSGLIQGAVAGVSTYIGHGALFSNNATTIGLGPQVTIQRVVAHGLVGGMSAELQGGSFKAGLVSSSLGKLTTPFVGKNKMRGVLQGALIGGTASVLSGGKFVNGAVTTGIQYANNFFFLAPIAIFVGKELVGMAVEAGLNAVGANSAIIDGVQAVRCLSGGVSSCVKSGKKLVAKGGPKSFFHYTDDAGLEGIKSSKKLNPSLKAYNPKDARYGDGQYVSDIAPGTKSCAQLSRCFIGQPFQGNKFKNYVEIDVTGLNVQKGRDGVFVIPNDGPLDLTNRIISTGAN